MIINSVVNGCWREQNIRQGWINPAQFSWGSTSVINCLSDIIIGQVNEKKERGWTLTKTNCPSTKYKAPVICAFQHEAERSSANRSVK